MADQCDSFSVFLKMKSKHGSLQVWVGEGNSRGFWILLLLAAFLLKIITPQLLLHLLGRSNWGGRRLAWETAGAEKLNQSVLLLLDHSLFFLSQKQLRWLLWKIWFGPNVITLWSVGLDPIKISTHPRGEFLQVSCFRNRPPTPPSLLTPQTAFLRALWSAVGMGRLGSVLSSTIFIYILYFIYSPPCLLRLETNGTI